MARFNYAYQLAISNILGLLIVLVSFIIMANNSTNAMFIAIAYYVITACLVLDVIVTIILVTLFDLNNQCVKKIVSLNIVLYALYFALMVAYIIFTSTPFWAFIIQVMIVALCFAIDIVYIWNYPRSPEQLDSCV